MDEWKAYYHFFKFPIRCGEIEGSAWGNVMPVTYPCTDTYIALAFPN